MTVSSSDSGETIGQVKDNGNGTYTATVTSSTTVGTATITATDGAVSGSAALTQTAGPVATVTVALSPSSIIADGLSQTTATATVTDAWGHGLAGQPISFRTSDPGQFIGQVTDSGNGTYTSQIRGSTTIGNATITASVGAVAGSAVLTQTGTSTTSLVLSPASAVTDQPVTLVATVSSSTGVATGTVTFAQGGVPIGGCGNVPVSGSSPVATCQTAFGAASSPEQLTAAFAPAAGSGIAASIGRASIAVAPASTATALKAPSSLQTGASATYVATVTGASGPFQPSGNVAFRDGGATIGSCAGQPLVNGQATCTISYHAAGSHSISAAYGGDGNFNASSSPAATVSVAKPPAVVLGTIAATMDWTFYYTPTYTRVLSLVINGASVHESVVIRCHGRGCPFARRAPRITETRRCGAKGKKTCRFNGTLALIGFRGHSLHPGAKITISITRAEWIGKYYEFKIRAGHGPHVQIGCLAPGAQLPGGAC